jgi:hypothetical protein
MATTILSKKKAGRVDRRGRPLNPEYVAITDAILAWLQGGDYPDGVLVMDYPHARRRTRSLRTSTYYRRHLTAWADMFTLCVGECGKKLYAEARKGK